MSRPNLSAGDDVITAVVKLTDRTIVFARDWHIVLTSRAPEAGRPRSAS